MVARVATTFLIGKCSTIGGFRQEEAHRSLLRCPTVDAFLDRPNARIAYSVQGRLDGAKPVVIAHSFLASRELEDRIGIFDWSPAAGNGSALIRFDARGHGQSSGETAEEDYRWPALAQDLLAVLDAAAPGVSTVDAVAESTGCGTLLWAVSQAPERFGRLVLVIPPTVRDTRAEQGELYRATAGLVEFRGAEAWARLVDTFPSIPLLDAGGWARARQVPVDLSVLPAVLRGAAGSDLPPDEVLSGLQQPTLILGWTTDPSHPTASAELLARLLPNSTMEIASEPDEVRGWGARAAAFLADA
jgi:pimeloyl-ACP methyl ester carboxylesterase